MARKQLAKRWAEQRRQRDEEERQSRVMVITEFMILAEPINQLID